MDTQFQSLEANPDTVSEWSLPTSSNKQQELKTAEAAASNIIELDSIEEKYK